MESKSRNRTGHWRRRLLILPPLVVGVAAILLAPSIKSRPQQASGQSAITAARVIEARPITVIPRATGYGSVMPGRTWEGVAEVAGQVTWTADVLESGRRVAAGTELLRIDDADYRLALAQVQAQRDAAAVKLETTRASLAIADQDLKLLAEDYRRKKTLGERGALASSAVDAAQRLWLNGRIQVQNLKNTLSVTQAEQKVLGAQLASAQRNLQRTSVIAPFDVRLVEVNTGLARYANKGQLLLTADGIDRVEVAAQFAIGLLRPLIQAASVSAAGPAGGVHALGARVSLRTPTHTVEWPATVGRVAGAVDPQTQSAGVVVVIDSPEAQAVPGERPRLLRNTFVEVELSAPPLTERIVIPRAAWRDGRVFVVDGDGRLAIRPVEIAFTQGGLAIVADGLAPGEQVVVTDLIGAVEGMAIDARVDEPLASALVREASGQVRQP